MIVVMIIFIHKKGTLQITAKNKQQSHNLRINPQGTIQHEL